MEEIKWCGSCMPVDIVAAGDELPLPDKSQDFVISSHVLEHFPDPIKASKKWHRVIKDGGYIFMIVPHEERTYEKEKERTTLRELIDRHEGKVKLESNFEKHHSAWITEDVVELVNYLGWKIVFIQDVDDKVGNGFTIVIQNGPTLLDPTLISNSIRNDYFNVYNSLIQTEGDLEAVLKILLDQKEKVKMRETIQSLEKRINLMENSKFWKMRNFYISIKRFLRV